MKINGNPDGGGGGGVITGLTATENGIYMPSSGVDGFAPVEVDVQPSLQDMTITVNGSYTADQGYYGLNTVTVNVPDVPPVTSSLEVTVNGVYIPGTGVDGFSQVTVDVPQSGYTEKDITEKKFNIVNLNNSASLVGSYMFFYNSSLKTIDLSNCKEIYEVAFRNCSSLSQVNLPVCEFIGGSAFYQCPSLSQVNIPNVLSIGYYGFGYCTSLSVLSVPLVSNLANYCFNGCNNLQELTLCNETYKIPIYQARMLSGTRIMTDGSIYVASDMYSRWIVSVGWSSLASRFVSISQSGPVLSYDTGVVYGITRYIDDSYSTYLNISETDVLKLSLSNISSLIKPFVNYTNLTTISLPVCKYIGEYAFSGCSSLSDVSLPVCEYIGHSAFALCSSLSDVSLPVCSYISEGAFRSTPLTQINLPVCSYVYSFAFSGCSSLSDVSLPVCEYIGSYAFAECFNLTTVILGYSSVVSADNYVFANDHNLSAIYVPVSLVDTYKSAQYWSYFSSIIFPIE